MPTAYPTNSTLVYGKTDRARALIARWVSETQNVSSLSAMKSHPAFVELVSIGRGAISAIMDAYTEDAPFLYLILARITDENPVPESARGDIQAIREAWIEWGNKRKDTSANRTVVQRFPVASQRRKQLETHQPSWSSTELHCFRGWKNESMLVAG